MAVRRSNQLSYEATDIGRRSFVGTNVPLMNESRKEMITARIIASLDYVSAVQYMIHFNLCIISFVDSFVTGRFQPTNDQLPTSVAS